MKPRTVYSEIELSTEEQELIDIAEEHKLLHLKWNKNILLKLGKRKMCFCDLADSLIINKVRITDDMLTKRLKAFVKSGWIIQVDSYSSSDQKDYTLTEKGKRAVAHIHAGILWVIENRKP